MASIKGEPASKPTLAGDAEADLKTATAKVPHGRDDRTRHPGAALRIHTGRIVSGIVTSGRHCGQATRAALLRNQGRRLRLPRRTNVRHRHRRHTHVEVPVLLWSDRLPGVVRPRQVALVLPSRRERRPIRRVRGYSVDVDLRRTARGAVSLLVLGIVGVVLGIVLTLVSLVALVWLYQSWIAPSLGL